ncbi:leucyl/phenylalanyl-tRNA--protein transferase [Niabella ginsenosidivorans]|uniref:Leucyl/phenylalanyl-tRNA--protein transferase n=1 Tax=Niabella ginsenosidivorans TaxID=1176587 RepID=A0A1A9HZ59_9BACT|nr:leucyl/phenylalanyl-tRNA--protein transferase [Niabella ginsenosidivorans]ANH80666.1 leucyl/phenylalanyl-tRNA--protein transferase [Niabella ginsenosidivorans]
MPIFALSDAPYFPPVHLAEPDGLLAIGGDLTPQRILHAYSKGIFPWYETPPVLWWSPDPRFVLFPDEFRISKTVRSLLNKSAFHFTINQAFEKVIRCCQQVKRAGQEGTWITDEIVRSYTELHQMGYAHSAEVWQNNELVGGLYGIRLGTLFCGESMFSLVSNASRYAFARYMDQLKKEKVQLIDCQVYSEYLESMGARMIDRKAFLQYLPQSL